MQALGAMRYERGVQALTDLFHYFGKGDAAEAALDALAHIAPSDQRAAVRRAARRARARRCAAPRSKGWRAPATRIAAAGDSGASSTRSAIAASRWPAPSRRCCSATARPIRSPTRWRGRECASRRSATWSRSRPAGPRRSRHQLLDSDPQIRLDVVDALGLAGDPAAIAALEPLTMDKDPAGRARRGARRRAAA